MPVREETRPRAVSPSGRASGKQATEEQKRMAQLTSSDAVPDLLERARRVMEVTSCTEEVAYVALHDSGFSADLAVDAVLSTPKDEWAWSTTAKSKKTSKTESTSSRRGGMANNGFSKGAFRTRSDNPGSDSNDSSRQTSRPARAEGSQRTPRFEVRQRSDSSRGQGSSRGRGGGFVARGGMPRTPASGRSTNGPSVPSVRPRKPEARESEPEKTKEIEVVEASPVSSIVELAKKLPTSSPASSPELDLVTPVVNLVNVPTDVVVLPDTEADAYLYKFPENTPFPALGVCRIRRSSIPQEIVVMPPKPASSAGQPCDISIGSSYPAADRQLAASPAIVDGGITATSTPLVSAASEPVSSPRMGRHSRGHSRSHSNASNSGGADVQQPAMAHFSAESEVSADTRQQVQDHTAAASAPVLLRAASPQPSSELPSETTTAFAALPDSSRAILNQAALSAGQHHPAQQQQHMMMQPHQPQQQQHNIHSMPQAQNPLSSQQAPPQHASEPAVAANTPTSVLLRNPSQHNTATVTAASSGVQAVTSSSEVEPSVGSGSEMSAPMATAAVSDTPFSSRQTLPPGVSSTNPQERSLQDSRSAAINAAASLASASASAAEPQQPSRQSGNKSGPNMYMQNSTGYMPHQYMQPMMQPYDYDNGAQQRSRMNGMHETPVQTTYQASNTEQSGSSSVLGPAPAGSMSMLPQQAQQQQQQQQQQAQQQQQQQQPQPMAAYYNNMYGFMYPHQVPFPHGPMAPYHGYQRSHPYNPQQYMPSHPSYSVGLPGYDEEAGGYQGGSAQGGQVKGGSSSNDEEVHVEERE